MTFMPVTILRDERVVNCHSISSSPTRSSDHSPIIGSINPVGNPVGIHWYSTIAHESRTLRREDSKHRAEKTMSYSNPAELRERLLAVVDLHEP